VLIKGVGSWKRSAYNLRTLLGLGNICLVAWIFIAIVGYDRALTMPQHYTFFVSAILLTAALLRSRAPVVSLNGLFAGVFSFEAVYIVLSGRNTSYHLILLALNIIVAGVAVASLPRPSFRMLMVATTGWAMWLAAGFPHPSASILAWSLNYLAAKTPWLLSFMWPIIISKDRPIQLCVTK